MSFPPCFQMRKLIFPGFRSVLSFTSSGTRKALRCSAGAVQTDVHRKLNAAGLFPVHGRLTNMLQVSLRDNKVNGAKKQFFFRSSNNGSLSTDELVKEMYSFNTTITEADTLGVLNVLKRLVVKYVNLGYTVHTPLGYFHASASGSTDDADEDFAYKSLANNHEISLLYCPSAEVNSNVQDGIKIERVSGRLIISPEITIVKNAVGENTAEIKPNDSIVILGNYLKYDESDDGQGVFLKKDGTETRLTYCPHNTDGKLEARIPAGTAAGEYTVIVRNKPSSVILEVYWKKLLVITA